MFQALIPDTERAAIRGRARLAVRRSILRWLPPVNYARMERIVMASVRPTSVSVRDSLARAVEVLCSTS
jgi:hypothetical protein